jgi:hypothetical protein
MEGDCSEGFEIEGGCPEWFEMEGDCPEGFEMEEVSLSSELKIFFNWFST